jgi:hypothetical protein
MLKLTSLSLPNLAPLMLRVDAASIVNWPRNSSCEGSLASLGKPFCELPTEGEGGPEKAPNVDQLANLLANQVTRCPMGQAGYATAYNK